jgi:PEGA domain-containing protein
MEEVRRLALAIAMLAVSPVAHAEPALDEARAHFKSGTDLYDENNFRGALVEFQRAYELAPSYKILFNIGQVDMELQDYAGALTAYRRYLREGGPDVAPSRIAQVKEDIDRLTRRVGHIVVQTAAGAEVLIDDLRVGFAPLPEAATVNTGRHQVTVHVRGHEPETRVVDIAGQQDVTVALGNEVAPTITVEHHDDNTTPPKPASKTSLVVAWSITGVLALTAGTFGVLALTDDNDLSNLRNTFPVTKAQLDSARSKETTAAAIADGATAATLIAGGVALYMTLTHPRATDKLTAGVTPTGAFVAGRF